MDGGIFIAVPAGKDNYYQLSGQLNEDGSTPLMLTVDRPGVPLSELSVDEHSNRKVDVPPKLPDPPSTKASPPAKGLNRSLASIAFVRSRMMYARAALNGKGNVRFGLRHIREERRHGSMAAC